MKVTIKYGLTGRVVKENVVDGTTVGELVNDPHIRGTLGYGESVNAVIDGNTVDFDDEVDDGDVITVEKRAASKA